MHLNTSSMAFCGLREAVFGFRHFSMVNSQKVRFLHLSMRTRATE